MYLANSFVFVTLIVGAIFGKDVTQSVHLINDVTAGMECTVAVIGTDELHKVKHGEKLQVNLLSYTGAGYFVSCGVGVSGSGDLERSEMEGIFRIESTGSNTAEAEHYMSNYLTSVTRVVRHDLTADRLLDILNS